MTKDSEQRDVKIGGAGAPRVALTRGNLDRTIALNPVGLKLQNQKIKNPTRQPDVWVTRPEEKIAHGWTRMALLRSV